MSWEEPEFETSAVAAVFGRTAATYDTVIPFFTSFGERLVEAAALAPGERVLDLGCGRGATLLPASVGVGATGWVVGIDLSEDMVAILSGELEAAGIENATVRLGDAQALDVEGATFDVVLSQMVLHLLPDPTLAAAECFRVLVPGGRCVASAPSGAPGWEFVGPLFESFGPRMRGPMAMPLRPEFDLPGTLSGAGFEIVGDEQVALGFVFADEKTWWDWTWSGGFRAFYEVLAPEDLEDLREQAFAALADMRTPEGIPLTQQVRVVVAAKR